jgi:SNF2 family DNA or RNA helicase
MKFFRIICDEAHSIRNRFSRTSIAIRSLNSLYKWALTATPIQVGSIFNLILLMFFKEFFG